MVSNEGSKADPNREVESFARDRDHFARLKADVAALPSADLEELQVWVSSCLDGSTSAPSTLAGSVVPHVVTVTTCWQSRGAGGCWYALPLAVLGAFVTTLLSAAQSDYSEGASRVLGSLCQPRRSTASGERPKSGNSNLTASGARIESIESRGLPIFLRLPLSGGSQALAELSEAWASRSSSEGRGSRLLDLCDRRENVSVSFSEMPAANASANTFCVVRDPYERILSLYRQEQISPRGNASEEACLKGLNEFVANLSSVLSKKKLGPNIPCKLLPQVAFVYRWDLRRSTPDLSKPRCGHVLHFKDLRQELNSFLFSRKIYTLRLERDPQDYEDQPMEANATQACPMLTRRWLNQASRKSIENAFNLDFHWLAFQKLSQATKPEFIHIPRNGGSMLEELAQNFELWGSRNPKFGALPGYTMPYPIGGHICSAHHIPPSVYPTPYSGQETFCVVRDVYTRLISQFGSTMAFLKRYKCNASELNRFVLESLTPRSRLRLPFSVPRFPYGSDCHFMPQAGYVYSWDSKKQKVDLSMRWCKRVLRYENLTMEMTRFWRELGYPMKVPENKLRGCHHKLKPHNFTDASLDLIRQIYKDDLTMLSEVDYWNDLVT